MGWQPMLMRDEQTGLPFTRWFPPPADPDHHLIGDNVGFPPNRKTCKGPLGKIADGQR